ncbi:MAG: DUF3822 family protein [Chitinophagaceae bacterium]
MINPLYHIQKPEGTEDLIADCTLILQVDTNALFYVLIYNDKLVELKYFRLETDDQDSFMMELETVLQESLGNTSDLKKLVIIFNFPDNSLVPKQFYSPEINREIIELVHGDLQKGTILSEEVKDWNLHNVYRIPSEVYELIRNKFPTDGIWHFTTPWLHSLAGGEEGLKLIVFPGYIMIHLTRDGKLLISQRFPYETDDDIYFYLLNLLDKFRVEAASTPLEVSGFILGDSSLLTNLRNYFPLMKLSTSKHVTGQFPAHFFSSILNVATCVL